ncbi:MAG: hypothetical protein ABSB49_15390 [Polyangia bacterium]
MIDDAGLVKTLAVLARWRSCSVCGALVLYVDELGHSDGDFACGRCCRQIAAAVANDNGASASP